jgi:hypothetical protein
MKIPLRVESIQNDHARGHRCLSAAAMVAGVEMGYESLIMCVSSSP